MKGIVFSGALSILLSFILTPTLIRILAKRGIGQMIRDDGPQTHHVKRGTPTMGGIVLILSTIIAYFASHLFTGTGVTASAILVIALIVGLGAIGLLDDLLKIYRKQSLGLTARQKLLGQAIFAAGFAYTGLQFEDESGLAPISMYFSGVRDTSIKLGMFFVILWVIFLVLGSSNGVNLTDGLDGLASGAAIMTFLSFIVIGVWEFGQSCAIAITPQCYNVRDPLDIAVLSAALAGSCAGFLWWNAAPAKIFMGDVGSLALGGAISGIAIVLRVEALLAALGGLFVLITLSVIIQTGYFKLSGGKRVFKMAPLQHHFELLGWGEVTIVIRFWILAGMSVAAGLGLFYGQWVVSQ
ncbi:Rfe UDP-N-acetylmuramyl pentapeptide phosphotransferase/UDP-N- acetylglucosamine-1-phosphate transferase [actinobacterium SCGC AAA044-D11]